MEIIFSGKVGFFFTELAFVSALLCAISYFTSIFWQKGAEGFRSIGKYTFVLHAIAVTATIITLLGLILTKQYQYHYVYSHSSNELPLHYVIACLWEGQEGSFLLWMFWHSILGVWILWRVSSEWKAGVVGTIAAIEVILSSMLLGIVLNATIFKVILVVLLFSIWALAIYWGRREGARFCFQSFALIGISTCALALGLNILLEQTGFLQNPNHWFHYFEALFFLIFLVIISIWYRQSKISFSVFSFSWIFVALGFALFYLPVEDIKIGSTPFLLLREVNPNLPVFQVNPDYVPPNGKGLNSLLQNYWMVIHPPTLFLGFASTIVPFAFFVAGCLQRKYVEWMKNAWPWLLFSVMILGVGIMMGGYWAYETLNFGGYWNWDPVENASLVPWLTGVGAVHAFLLYQKGKSNFHTGVFLVISTFILVLYSTFLTRSGILGDSSVHSFTDLGLSGQLLLLLFAFLLATILLVIWHWRYFPQDSKEISLYSKEFFLLLAALILSFTALEISLVTSLPVFNKIFGTHFAPPANIQFFYYKWNVWLAILIALFSAIGQFFFWVKIEKKALADAIFRPFLVAVIAAVFIMAFVVISGMRFVYTSKFHEEIQSAASWGDKIIAYITNGILLLSDELLLFSSLFTVLANGQIIIILLRKKKFNIKHSGGALAHIGFGLMLIGFLFSSGYEDTVSINWNPKELGNQFPEESKKDNVLLVQKQPKIIKDYRVTYQGRIQAQAPIKNLKILHEQFDVAKVGFQDANDFYYALEFPASMFRATSAPLEKVSQTRDSKKEKAYDLAKLKFFIEQQLAILKPEMINERVLYKLEFTSLKDTNYKFILYPEAEMSEGMGIIAHPARKVYWNKDIYVHVSSIPAKPQESWEMLVADTPLDPAGDTLEVSNIKIILEGVGSVPNSEQFSNTAVAACLKLKIWANGKYYKAFPALIIEQDKRSICVDSYIPELEMSFAFLSAVPPKEGKPGSVLLRVMKKKPTEPDFITIKAISKPFINILWLGTFILTLGFVIALIKRLNRKREAKE
ncbi:MAG: cytochrome c biogenesis protein CcsA [Bacteroidia bacterium]|nr:cytochrome c biogenesis protein CcsA [Bacteroidia bacterium]MDW8157897.1 cytochrome c biogenesis protein CcsA [Bacteroidia bacterium]